MLKVIIEKMTCGHCVGAINNVIKGLESTATVEADLADKSIKIISKLQERDILNALQEAGYPAVVVNAFCMENT